MNPFPYREEIDPELIRAAKQAYTEAPPTHNTQISLFGWQLGREADRRADIPRGDHAEAA